MITEADFTRVKNDYCGNPRHVIHFLHFAEDYDQAVAIARKLGGKKYRGKDYGGGIVFQSYCNKHLANKINELLEG